MHRTVLQARPAVNEDQRGRPGRKASEERERTSEFLNAEKRELSSRDFSACRRKGFHKPDLIATKK